MIEKIKTITWEVRSHGFKTVVSDDELCTGLFCLDILNCMAEIDKPTVKKVVWHLQDVLKCMKKIEKEKEEKKAYEKSIKELGELLDESKKEKEDAGIIRKGEPVIVTPEWAEEKEKKEGA